MSSTSLFARLWTKYSTAFICTSGGVWPSLVCFCRAQQRFPEAVFERGAIAPWQDKRRMRGRDFDRDEQGTGLAEETWRPCPDIRIVVQRSSSPEARCRCHTGEIDA